MKLFSDLAEVGSSPVNIIEVMDQKKVVFILIINYFVAGVTVTAPVVTL